MILAGILSFAALQFDGYAGPSVVSPQAAYNAAGITLRDLLFQQPRTSVDAAQVLLAAQMASGRSGHWWYIEPNPPSRINSLLMAQWFWALRGNTANQELIQPTVPLQLDGNYSSSYLANEVMEDFPDPGKNGFHLFVPSWLRQAIVKQEPSWALPGRLLVIPTPSSDPAS